MLETITVIVGFIFCVCKALCSVLFFFCTDFVALRDHLFYPFLNVILTSEMVASRGDTQFVKLGHWNLMRLSLVYQPCYAVASLSELLDSGRLVSGVLQA